MSTPTREATALNSAVTAQIRSVLAIRRMRQSALATRMGVTEVWLSRRLREVQALSLDDVERICAALRVEPAELIAAAVRGTWQTTREYSAVPERPADTRPTGRPPGRTESVGPNAHRPRKLRSPAAERPSSAAA